MKQNVLIRLTSRIRCAGSPEETITQTMPGVLTTDGEWLEMSYEEPSEVPDAHVFTRIRISGVKSPSVTVSRSGSIQSRMTFKAGECSPADYRTAYGVLCMEINTKAVLVKQTRERLWLKLEYDTLSGKEKVTETKFSIYAVAADDNGFRREDRPEM